MINTLPTSRERQLSPSSNPVSKRSDYSLSNRYF